MTIKLENGVEVVGDMKDYYLMAEYDYHLITDPADYLLFIAGLYARIGMQKSVYPEELFNVGKINPVARAMFQSRRRTQSVPDKKKYDRKRDKKNVEKNIKKRVR